MPFCSLDNRGWPLKIIYIYILQWRFNIKYRIYLHYNIEVGITNFVNSCWVPVECAFPLPHAGVKLLNIYNCIQAGVKLLNKENAKMTPGFLLSMWEMNRVLWSIFKLTQVECVKLWKYGMEFLPLHVWASKGKALMWSYPGLTPLNIHFIWLMGMKHLKKLDEEK